MPPDDSDDFDELGDFHKPSSSPDTLQNTGSDTQNDHIIDSTSTSSDTEQKQSVINHRLV